MPRILITGASSGIGAALARHYAVAGTSLVLVGRNADRLEAEAQVCRARGAAVETAALDTRDRDAVRALVHATDAAGPLDLVVVNAAVNGGNQRGEVETEETAFETGDINYTGSLNVMLPALSLMLARGRGQIALMSSLAAYAPLPDAPAYSGAKAALVAHGLALRQKVGPRGVRISVVTPGYVKTPMGGELKGWRPLEVSAEQAAAVIARGLAKNRDVIAFPFALAALARTVLLLPESVRRVGLYAFRFQRRKRR
ncbi:SDR family NAD(P)-dependent oxidoreductase [Methylobacterium sp. NEAU 140]|uniref:SDR family NAD(P)-dependent oxidoreductase n=1 Tax=Methylobacterium sp. NEAU 140 TaxID=3064945 RepID=UPI0027330488|nr:SDR family NAD(P)-dependent oxidoreductase [Methylobacterium sp. NEAU 140]MDP4023270.1 SDR family NAD(P)-dependent oxidoreductase [Methylobacterium sp. NEAU 140]